MISKKMTTELTKQINAELFSAYLYMSMSSYAESTGFKGAAAWFAAQAQEELTHALKFYKYLNSQRAHVVLDAIAKPTAKFSGVKGMFEGALAHEKKITAKINALANLATAEKDHATLSLLQWFVTEQVEEEDNASDILMKLNLAGDKGGALFMIDRELGARQFGA